jgi:DNA-binding NtrC family response regulator
MKQRNKPISSMRGPRPRKSILLIEDEQPMALAIQRGMGESQKYDFRIDLVHNERDYIKRKLHKRRYDLYLVDLRLGMTLMNGMIGSLIISGETYRHVGSTIVVYSAYDSLDHIVAAMRRGATTFISKNQCRPDELRGRIEKLFEDEEERIQNRKELSVFLGKRGNMLAKKYTGKSVVIIERKVVASGMSRLETLLNYAEKRQTHQRWPEEPSVVEIGSEGLGEA